MAVSYGTKGGDAYWQLRGLSSDAKPTENVPNGSTFEEIDTGNEFMFDEGAGAWYLQPTNGGGGTVTAGVSTFNNRSGAVMPQTGDYTADMVGADPAGSAAAALTEANEHTNAALANFAVSTEFTQAVDTAVEEAIDAEITNVTEDEMNSLFPELYP